MKFFHKKRIIVLFFIITFIPISYFAVQYANGTILGDGWTFLKTGGIYVRGAGNDAEILLNNKPITKLGFLRNDYLIKNLKSGRYLISVTRNGFNDWKKEISVFKNKVTEVGVFAIPRKIIFTDIFQYLDNKNVATSSFLKNKTKINPEYTNVADIFASSTKYLGNITNDIYSTSTFSVFPNFSYKNYIEKRKVISWYNEKDLYVGWISDEESIPDFLCEDFVCQKWVKSFSFSDQIKKIDFFPGANNALVVLVGNEIYAIEAGINYNKVPQLVYKGQSPNFLILNGNYFYIKDGKNIMRADI